MRTITEGKENVCKLLGTQRARKEGSYRLMRHVLRTECAEGTLLLNVITGQLVLLSAEEAAALQELPAPVELVEEGGALAELMSAHFLVPLDYDEGETTRKLRMLMSRLFAPKGINSYTVLTTTDCNARCFYCYQAGRAHIGMSAETADEFVKYIVAHKAEGSVKIHWFGGEPLVGMARIEQVCSALRERDIEYSSKMTSNGYLFTEDVVEKAVRDWKLTRVQITLDGTEEIYNRTKAYHGIGATTSSPYQRVLAHIQSLADHEVKVSIRLNLDKHNYDDLASLVDELGERFAHNDYISVYAHVLFENEGFEPIQRNDEEDDVLHKRQLELETRIAEVGLSKAPTSLPSLKVYGCMADSPGTTVVYPDGRLFKCQHTTPGDDYGSLEQGVTRKENADKFKQLVHYDECDECALYPNCIMLTECPNSHRTSCNKLLRERIIKKHLQAMVNVFTAEGESAE